MKTLSFYCAASSIRCTLDQDVDVGSDALGANNSDIDSLLGKKCDGRLILFHDESRHPRLQLVTFSFELNRTSLTDCYPFRCEFQGSDHTAHLELRNLQEYDLKYLVALFKNNLPIIQELESAAQKAGYGPLAPCSFTASPSQQQQFCRE